jgi:hypothetical protein
MIDPSRADGFNLDKAEAWNSIVWILKNNIRNENGSPIEFRDHTFMIAPYLDNTPMQVALKCAQIGWSTLAILRSFHLARYAGANIIHTFPSRNMAKDFVVPKVDPLIANNPTIQKMMGSSSTSLKQVGNRFIYYRGSYEQTEAISISAHILINDEYDRSNQMVLKTYRSRLDDAKREMPELGWEWRFSNPTIPGYGVDELWRRSDQKHWFVKCSRCNYDWYLMFPDNFNFETRERICGKCHNPLRREDLQNGRWVNKTDSEVSGYWISQVFVPWISAGKIIDDSLGDQEVFYNFTLGLPYISKDTSISRETIIKCISPGYNPKSNVAIGVDNGVEKHYVIGNRYGIFKVGITEDWGEIENLRNQYGATMVIDAMPYPNTPSKLAKKYPGKVFVHYYQPDKNQIGTIRWEQYEVKSDRLKIIDAVVAELNAGDIIFNTTSTELETYINHWEQVYRMIDTTPAGVQKPRWATIEGRPDHFAHATVYWRVALEKTLGQGGIVRAGGGVTRKGNPVVSADSTVPALNLDEALERARKLQKRRGWK